jgi:hypothetical protein
MKEAKKPSYLSLGGICGRFVVKICGETGLELRRFVVRRDWNFARSGKPGRHFSETL